MKCTLKIIEYNEFFEKSLRSKKNLLKVVEKEQKNSLKILEIIEITKNSSDTLLTFLKASQVFLLQAFLSLYLVPKVKLILCFA